MGEIDDLRGKAGLTDHDTQFLSLQGRGNINNNPSTARQIFDRCRARGPCFCAFRSGFERNLANRFVHGNLQLRATFDDSVLENGRWLEGLPQTTGLNCGG